jgi:hypothetical protein
MHTTSCFQGLVEKFFISTIDANQKIVDQLSIEIELLSTTVTDRKIFAELEDHFRSLILKISMLDGRLVVIKKHRLNVGSASVN